MLLSSSLLSQARNEDANFEIKTNLSFDHLIFILSIFILFNTTTAFISVITQIFFEFLWCLNKAGPLHQLNIFLLQIKIFFL